MHFHIVNISLLSIFVLKNNQEYFGWRVGGIPSLIAERVLLKINHFLKLKFSKIYEINIIIQSPPSLLLGQYFKNSTSVIL